jgi:hypothetical protein
MESGYAGRQTLHACVLVQVVGVLGEAVVVGKGLDRVILNVMVRVSSCWVEGRNHLVGRIVVALSLPRPSFRVGNLAVGGLKVVVGSFVDYSYFVERVVRN